MNSVVADGTLPLIITDGLPQYPYFNYDFFFPDDTVLYAPDATPAQALTCLQSAFPMITP